MVPRSPRARRKRLGADQRKVLILDAAARAFAEHGYERTSIAQIAAGAGIAKSVVYDHFRSKQALHIELLRRQAEALVAHAARRFDVDSPEALLRANTAAFFEFVEQHPFAWRMLFREPAERPAILQVHHEIQRQSTRALAELIDLYPSARLLAQIPRREANEMLAETIKSTNNALAAWWWDHRNISRQQLTDFSVDVLWKGLERLTEPPELKAGL